MSWPCRFPPLPQLFNEPDLRNQSPMDSEATPSEGSCGGSQDRAGNNELDDPAAMAARAAAARTLKRGGAL